MKILLAAAVALSALFVASPAQAQDQRTCVSLREYRGMDVKATRKVIEQRWDVTGRGRVLSDQRTDYSYPVRYRACGYSYAEVFLVVVYHADNDWGITALRLGPEVGATAQAPV